MAAPRSQSPLLHGVVWFAGAQAHRASEHPHAARFLVSPNGITERASPGQHRLRHRRRAQTSGAVLASHFLRDPDLDRELGAVLRSLPPSRAAPCTGQSRPSVQTRGRRHLGLLLCFWGYCGSDGRRSTAWLALQRQTAVSLCPLHPQLPGRLQPLTPPLPRLGPSCQQDMQPWFHRELAMNVPF